MKFTIIKSCLARFSDIFEVGTPSNIHGTAISYRCAKFGAFVNSVTILTLRDLTIRGMAIIISYPTRTSGIIVLLKTATKYREFLPTSLVKTTDFQLGFNFE